MVQNNYQHTFVFSFDEYYVGDVGYPNVTSFLTPYKGVHYYRSDFWSGGKPLEGKQMISYRHSLLECNRALFCYLGSRWPILM